MFHVFACRYPAAPNIRREDAIQAVLSWVNDSRFYQFKEVQFQGLYQRPPYHDSCTCQEATLEFISCATAYSDCIAARLERSADATNTLWQADVIFEQPHDAFAQAWFHVRMGRGVLRPEQSADFSIVPRIPDITWQLTEKGLVSGSDTTLPLFPTVTFCKDCLARCPMLPQQLGEWIAPIAHIDPAPQGEADVCLAFPRLNILRTYSLSGSAEELIHTVAVDVMTLVSQSQPAEQTTWEELEKLCPQCAQRETDETPTAASYCFMNQEMADLLRTNRRALGLSQKQLGEAANTSGLVVSRLETLRVSRVTAAVLHDLEAALGLQSGALTSLAGKKRPIQESAPAPEPPTADPARSRFCRLCGAPLYEDSRFCSACGERVLP